MSGWTSNSHLRFFPANIGLNSCPSCSSIIVRLILLYTSVMFERLNLVISKNSLISSSRRSALSSEMDRYFSRSSSEIWFSSLNRFKYPITDESGVFKSWARYITRSFFRCSASSASVFRFVSVCRMELIFLSVEASSGGRAISLVSSCTRVSIPRLISLKYFEILSR